LGEASLRLEPFVLDAEADLALLRPRGPVAEGLHELAVAPPVEQSRWKLDGFPAAGRGRLLRLGGTVTAVREPGGPEALQLKVDEGTGWEGVSGSPVLCAERVVGVMTRELADNIGFAASAESLRRLLWFAGLRELAEQELAAQAGAGQLAEAWDLEGLLGAVHGLEGLEGLRAELVAGHPAGLSIAVIAPTGTLGAHRAAVVERLTDLPGVSEVRALRAEVDADLAALDHAQLVVALLGWTLDGKEGLQRALDIEGVFAFVDENEPRGRRMTPAQRRERNAIEELMDLAGEPGEFAAPADAADKVVQAIAPTLRPHAPGAELVLRDWERAWLEKRIEAWKSGDMTSLHGSLGSKAPLRTEVYVPLRVREGVFWQDSLGKLRAQGEEDVWKKDIQAFMDKSEEALRAQGKSYFRNEEGFSRRFAPHAEAALSHPSARCAVLQGRAGSGKTVLLQNIAWTLAARHLRGPGVDEGAINLRGLRGGAPRLPIPVLLKASELAELLAQDHERNRVSLRTAARAVHAALEEVVPQPPTVAALRDELAGGRLLLLLDALDEVPEQTARGSLLRYLEQQANTHGALRVLLSARPPADTGLLSPREPLVHLELAPLDSETRRQLVERWRIYWGREPAFTEAFLAALTGLRQRGASLEIDNPLILTAAIVVFEVGQRKLPEDPAELHERLVDHLCSTRRRCRTAEGALLTADQKRRISEWVFLGMQRAGGTEWALDAAARALAGNQELGGLVSRRDRDARELINDLIEDTALLRQEPGESGPVLRPVHRSFQEYLAACGWVKERVKQSTEDQIAPLLAGPVGETPVEDPAWRRVIVFLAGVYGAPRAQLLAETLLAWMNGGGPRAVQEPDALCLRVAEMLVDYPQHFTDSGLREGLRQTMAARYAEDGPRWPLARRVGWLEVLGVLGDPRLQEGPWVRVPGGTFAMGGEPYGAMPAQRRVVADVILCWRPVTVEDYRRFVDSPHYTKERWWRWGGLLGERPRSPGSWELQVQHPTWPVTDVSWVEACAFCAWASEHDRAWWQLSEGQVLDLPAEVEWEFVAGGEEGRVFPWGDAPLREGEEAQANWWDCGLRGPSPVGAFPSGAPPGVAGRVVDLAGDVFEWCRDAWTRDVGDARAMGVASVDMMPVWSQRVDHVVDTFGRPVDSSAPRVVRGGAWLNDDPGYLRCAVRHRLRPENRRYDLGFRLVLRRVPELEP
ncbi:MAG: SUMF1/EgtB/PvdO family nonheme iron enzyme, partial [Alphaproteobacteria bacterium]|nr:SUMF1/EgtB/PvdO family nonheme iron enzyme [Alphaproteobacteria bacterium]